MNRVSPNYAGPRSNSSQLEPFPDAIPHLWIDIVPRTVVYSFGDVRWDGAEQAPSLGPIEWSLFGRKSSANVGGGPIQAVSLGTRLTGVDGRILYDSLGGIQLLQRIWTRGTAQYMQMRVLDLPSEQLFRDPAREKGAVHLALRSLVLRPEELRRSSCTRPVAKSLRSRGCGWCEGPGNPESFAVRTMDLRIPLRMRRSLAVAVQQCVDTPPSHP